MIHKQRLVIQTNKDGAEVLQREIASIPEARCQARQVQGQSGLPNAWSVVAEIAIKSIGVLATPLITLLGKGDAVISIENPMIGKVTCRTVDEFERILALLKD